MTNSNKKEEKLHFCKNCEWGDFPERCTQGVESKEEQIAVEQIAGEQINVPSMFIPKEEKSWEEELDKKFKTRSDMGIFANQIVAPSKEIKSFITDLLASQKARYIKRIEEITDSINREGTFLIREEVRKILLDSLNEEI